MSFHWCDNIHTTIFTPRDYQIELLSAAFERNVMICLGHKSSKEFIALKLLQELARPARLAGKINLYLTCEENGPSITTMVEHLTHLRVYKRTGAADEQLSGLPDGYQLYVLHPRTCLAALRDGVLNLTKIYLLTLEDCHEADVYRDLRIIFSNYYNASDYNMPKILGLAGPLHSAECSLNELSAMLNTLESSVHCKAETASDIVTVLRYCSKPTEYIVQCTPYQSDELTAVLEEIIGTRKAFLIDHRYDPFEIYSTDEYLEELKDIPDPKLDPMEFLDTMLFVLYEMGPWCADRVAINMFHRIEKQKIKTPHERHYILLCVVNTALLEFHAICELAFKKYTNHKELVERYSSPKVLRLLEILRLFKPEELIAKNETIHKMSQDLEQMDFQKLSRSIEYSCQNVENVTTKLQLESRSIIDNLDPIVKSPSNEITKQPILQTNISNKIENSTSGTNRRHGTSGGTHGRYKRRPFSRRQMRDNSDSLDTLCAIIFCNSNYTARVLFDLLSEMSRHDPELKFLKCQFTTDRVADPQTEPKEAEIEHRRQEEVLKRFRMHDCNILIGTSVLEEGIDLPKCNLVVRWDAPTTYRSYVQCKGRARAAPAYHVILVSPTYKEILSENEQLSEQSHRYICKLEYGQDDAIESDESCIEDDDDDKNSKFRIGSSKGIVKILNPEVITNKPPTKTEITLKEIKDELLAIKDVEKDLVDSKEEIETKSLAESKCDTSTNKEEAEMKSTNNKSLDSCYEVLNLCDAISDVSNASSLFLEEMPGTTTSPAAKPKPLKQKRRFKCLYENEDSGERSHNSLDATLTQIDFTTNKIVDQLAEYREIEKMLLQRCANKEPPEAEHQLADNFNKCIKRYKPLEHLLTGASVDLTSSVALVNKYCSKLPSDTFTKLTALWRCTKTTRCGAEVYQYTIRLPINSPLKYDIVGLPLSSNIVARRIAALQACIELHKTGELDDNLQPIGKEGFRAMEPDWENFELEEEDEKIVHENSEPRPGTTKRRQYYYKRIASEFSHCRPTAGVPCYLYFIDLTLQCPIPEEQNTRGRKIYPPEDAQQGFGILTLKRIPKVSSFPIFTRSGEVKVSIVLAKEPVILTETQIRCINTFLNYTFTNVLRLQKFLMLFDPDSTENCVFIVPTVKRDGGKIIDWQFLQLIERNASMMPTPVPEELRKSIDFDSNKFRDAVVMPWYRNQDQPQYFYVAEICPQLSPLSCFPGENYRTFKHYYFIKYGLTIQNVKQPLLDVDHTSARLNFLTPRYVNRKGVALPTSSEETKRAKRENLEQKQILVPELCTVHPFPASLWRTAVCLPCILYRINALLLADDIRKKVSLDIGLGQQEMPDNFEWPMLDFGWSLSEVLKRSKENKNNLSEKKNDESNVNNGREDKESNGLKEDSGLTNDGDEESKESKAKSANEIIIEGEKKLQDSTFIEIGTWSNDMADDINMNKNTESVDDEEEEYLKYFPSNVSFCDQQMRYGSPTFWDVKETQFNKKSNDSTSNKRNDANNFRKNSYAYYDSDDSFASSYDANEPANYSDDDDDDFGPLRIAFTSKNEAETIETDQEIEKRNKQLSIIQATNANERDYQKTKNLLMGYNFVDLKSSIEIELRDSIARFTASTQKLREKIVQSGILVKYNQSVMFARKEVTTTATTTTSNACVKQASAELFSELLPYADKNVLISLLTQRANILTIADIAQLNSDYLKAHTNELFEIQGCGDLFDNFNDKAGLKLERWGEGFKKFIKLTFDSRTHCESNSGSLLPAVQEINKNDTSGFSFDRQPDLIGHPGPSPSIILQALTMSNANDGINLERLETIGDSFLKYAITTYLYITYENVHEGKLSHLRSKQVANLNLYRLGRRKKLGEYMIATKFEPHDNWLPPCYYVPKELEKALIEAKIPPHHWKLVDLANIKKLNSSEICALVREKADNLGLFGDEFNCNEDASAADDSGEGNDFTCFIPYNLVTQHSIPDKSVADCVEALIGAYLIECGPRGALLFMAWLGIRVLPFECKRYDLQEHRVPGSTKPDENGNVTVYGEWTAPKSPLLHYAPNATEELESMLEGFDEFEAILGYKFRDRSYLLQAMTHASYSPNRLTDCYQRLEFLGDAVLDYLITRHLYEDPRQHSPGALTDLRSALVNNTIFASLAVRHGFHKYFRHLSPGLNEVIDRFVRIQNENGHCISEEYYLLSEEECDDAEDVEVPKALGDVFESIAGAIFLDSNMSLDVVWKVYSNMMKPEIEQFSNSVPKSPIRELLELEPETAKFGKPEKLADGRRVRVTVDVFCKGTFRGIGRNYRIAKCTAAKCALRQLKKQGLITKKD